MLFGGIDQHPGTSFTEPRFIFGLCAIDLAIAGRGKTFTRSLAPAILAACYPNEELIMLESLELNGNSTDKFWKIELKGNTFTICVGRTGVPGHSRTKSFSTNAEAQRAYDELVAQKLSKGYRRIESTSTSVHGADSHGKTSSILVPDAIVQQQKRQKRDPQGAVAKFNLKTDDLLWAVWRERVSKTDNVKREPFDLKTGFDSIRYEQGQDGMAAMWSNRFKNIESMSREEARFWITAYMNFNPKMDYKRYYFEGAINQLPAVREGQEMRQEYSKLLNAQSYADSLSIDTVLGPFGNDPLYRPVTHESHLQNLAGIACLAFTPEQVIELCLHVPPQGAFHVMQAFRKIVMPYLTDAQLKTLQETCKPYLIPEQAKTSDPESATWSAYTVAAFLRMPDELHKLVASFPNGAASRVWTVFHPQLYIISLGCPEDIITHAKRLELSLRFRVAHFSTIEMWLKAWIAATEEAGAEVVWKLVQNADSKQAAEHFYTCATLLEQPAMAPHMIASLENHNTQHLAKRWLQEHIDWAAMSLYEASQQKGPVAQIAEDILVSGRNRMSEESLPPGVLAEIKAKHTLPGEQYPEHDDSSLPEWLGSQITQVKPGKTPVPDWLMDLSTFPRIVVNNRRLTVQQMQSVLESLRQSTFEKPHQLIKLLHQDLDKKGVSDRFAWSLFKCWLKNGADSKQKWAMQSIGFLGSDETVMKLIPLIRVWPGESQHPRAVLGLECLRQIGTDTALMQINGLAQKLQFKGLKQKAVECMEQIARQRGMTRSELEDRIVPDCGLNERGQKVFDFGPRQFTFELSSELTATIRDADGKQKTDLPSPRSTDDPEKAQRAVADWKILKQQIKDVAKIQAVRLEQSMVTQRKWSKETFDSLLLKHPLMINLVRRLLWGTYDESGTLQQTFRVTEDQTFSNSDDRDVRIPNGAQLGIVHPMQIPVETRRIWGEIFADYQIITPFPQLQRPVYELDDMELQADQITRFSKTSLPAVSLVSTFEKQGWQKGPAEEGGCIYRHTKQFAGAEVMAVAIYQGIPVDMMLDWDEQRVESCFFVKMEDENAFKEWYWNWETTKKIPLREVNAIVVSEVLSDLTLVASKAKVSV